MIPVENIVVFAGFTSIAQYATLYRYGLGLSLAVTSISALFLALNNFSTFETVLVVEWLCFAILRFLSQGSFSLVSLILIPFVGLYRFVDRASDLLADLFVKFNKNYERSGANKKQEQQSRQSRSSYQNTNDQERAEQARNYRGGEGATSDTRSHEEVLGLKPGFSFEDLKEAYKREAQRLHPDRYTNKPKAFRDAIEQEMKRVVVAHQELKKRFNV